MLIEADEGRGNETLLAAIQCGGTGPGVDVYLPKEVRLHINMGDKVYAGVSLLGVVER